MTGKSLDDEGGSLVSFRGRVLLFYCGRLMGFHMLGVGTEGFLLVGEVSLVQRRIPCPMKRSTSRAQLREY